MYDRVNATELNDLMLPLSRRPERGVYFVRVCGWGDPVRDAVWAFHEAARHRGVVIEGQIGNPDERQFAYLNEVLGTAFAPDEAFLAAALQKWMPRMRAGDREATARALREQFDALKARGKSDSILRNLYFKAMCWLYYRFERLMPLLGDDDPPRVLYLCPSITAHELMLLSLLNRLGADILLLEPDGDQPYLRQDPAAQRSQLLVPEGTPFPPDFSLKQLRREMAPRPVAQSPRPTTQPPRPVAQPTRPTAQPPRSAAPSPRPTPLPARAIDPFDYFKPPAKSPCTNAWLQEADYTGILTPPARRGDDSRLFYNAFIRVKGVADTQRYLSDLHQFYERLQESGRRMVIVDEGLSIPTPEEIGQIRRRSYRTAEELIVDLAGNLPACASVELQWQMQRAFVQTMRRAQAAEPQLSRLMIAGVYLLCWVRRYQGGLFSGYRDGDMPCFILLNGCQSAQEALYPLYLSMLPADVLILAPDLRRPCALSDDRLLELTGESAMQVTRFPRSAGDVQLRTVAAHAEDDLTQTLYADSGIYRNRQFSKAEALTLQTTYDELFILWNQELKYRSGFLAGAQTVTMPVLYAKISGVEHGRPEAYWQKIKLLLDEDARLETRMPIIPHCMPNPYMTLALKAVRDRRLRRNLIMEDRQYPFGLLREPLQVHMLDKLQLMLDRRLIRGTFENGTEYTVAATVLNLDKALLRMLQSFDFTRKNPKLVCIKTDDREASLEDAILLTFLNLVGFDIALFVPTGYQTIERYLTDNRPVVHEIGDYLYDLTAPDFKTLPQPKGRSWLDNLFKRG